MYYTSNILILVEAAEKYPNTDRVKDIYRDFQHYCLQAKSGAGYALRTAATSAKKGAEEARTAHHTVARLLNLDTSVPRISDSVIIKELLPLDTPYPPKDGWVYESETIRSRWEGHLKTGRLHDQRTKCREMVELDPDQLQLDIAETESCIIRDKNTGKIAGMVLRNFCKSPEALAWASSLVHDNTHWRKNVRVCQLLLAPGCTSNDLTV